MMQHCWEARQNQILALALISLLLETVVITSQRALLYMAVRVSRASKLVPEDDLC